MIKVTIVEVIEFDETVTQYVTEEGKKYSSTYLIPDGIKYETVVAKTGKTNKEENKIFEQYLKLSEAEEIEVVQNIIKSANKIA